MGVLSQRRTAILHTSTVCRAQCSAHRTKHAEQGVPPAALPVQAAPVAVVAFGRNDIRPAGQDGRAGVGGWRVLACSGAQGRQAGAQALRRSGDQPGRWRRRRRHAYAEAGATSAALRELSSLRLPHHLSPTCHRRTHAGIRERAKCGRTSPSLPSQRARGQQTCGPCRSTRRRCCLTLRRGASRSPERGHSCRPVGATRGHAAAVAAVSGAPLVQPCLLAPIWPCQ